MSLGRLWMVVSILLGNGIVVQAQSGRVLAQDRQEPLAFASVVYDTIAGKGVLTDIDGYFSLPPSLSPTWLRISHISYQPKTVPWQYTDSIQEIILTPLTYALEPVWIEAERDPALALMRLVVAHKAQHDPSALSSFSCESYNKFVYDLLPAPTLPRFKNVRKDSALRAMKSFHEQSGIMVMESVNQHKYLQPNHWEEIVTATRVSGFQRPEFAALATDIQPFSFYDTELFLLGKNFLNPVSKGGLNKYRFILADTLVRETDSLFVINYRPKKGRIFDALKGQLFIHSSDYAVYSVEAQPSRQGPIELRIEQLYQYLPDSQWFPAQLNFEMRMPKYPDPYMGMRVTGKSYIRKVQLTPSFRPKDFDRVQSRMLPDAAIRDSAFWHQQRSAPLSQREQVTYQRIDSLGEARKFDRIFQLAGKLMDNRLPLTIVDVDLPRVLAYNEYEGSRWGMGLSTNDRLIPNISLGGYAGYGVKDQAWKYGLHGSWDIFPKNETQLFVQYANDLREPGSYEVGIRNPIHRWRHFLSERMDEYDGWEGGISSWVGKHLQATVSGRTYRLTPTYPYTWMNQEGAQAGPYDMKDLHLTLRYAWNEQFAEFLGQRISLGSDFPIFSASLSGAPMGWGDVSYLKAEFAIDWAFSIPRLGQSQLSIQAGMLITPEGQNSVPVSWLFYGNGSHSEDLWLMIGGTFQTMRRYEFLSDRFINVFLNHDFGPFLYRTSWSQPRLEMVHGIGIGRLLSPEAHSRLEFRSMNHGYFESGLILRQLLHLKFANIAYLGLGGGAFYRYGAYALPNTSDNLSFKLVLNAAIN